MLKSMTGFARINANNEYCDLRIEMKSVNSKYCDINLRMPKVFSFMDIPLRTLVQSHAVRGKIDIAIEVRFIKAVQAPALNRQNFSAALDVLEQMKKLGNINDDVTLSHLLSFQDLVEYETASYVEDMEPFITANIKECLNQLDEMRRTEGQNLGKNLDELLGQINSLAKQVEADKDDIYAYWVGRFKSRMTDMLADCSGCEDRIVQEASIYAEKADISEELARIDSHIKQFSAIIDKEFPCGKKLDFLSQELYREWNTVASKSGNTKIINAVVQAKAAVDSVREQIQNII